MILQGRTALADTAGSDFLKSCEQLLAEAQSIQLLERFVGQLPLLFRKSSDKGTAACSHPETLARILAAYTHKQSLH